MRRSVVGVAVALVGLAVAPRAAHADVTFPNPGFAINASTLTWFYGCTDLLPGGCVTLGVAQLAGSPTNNYVGFYGSGVGLVTPFGVPYNVNDSWSWISADNTCGGAGTNLFWAPNSCFVQKVTTEALTGRIFWGPVNQQTALVTLTATPEPASIALILTGLIAIGGLASRPGRSKFAD